MKKLLILILCVMPVLLMAQQKQFLLKNGVIQNMYAYDSASVSNLIKAKVDSITRTPGVDSFYYWKNGIRYAVKDSSGGASGITNGSTTMTGFTDKYIPYNNAGTVGQYSISGTGASIPTTISPVFTTPRLSSTSTTGYVWTATDGSGNGSFQVPAYTGTVTGTGTANYLSKWTSGTALGNSGLSDNGTNITTSETILPSITNTTNLGSSTSSFSAVWASTFRNSSGQIFFNDGNSQARMTSLLWEFGNRALTGVRDILFQTDNTYDIGSSGATRPRNLYVGTNGLFAGSVGIGTTSPAAKLDVLGTTEQLRLKYDASNYVSYTVGSSGALTVAPTGASITVTKPFILKGYTVATLPTGVQGMTAFVTDALTPTFGTTLVGGGAVVAKAFFDGTNWINE